jgi:hypothetical protein
VGIHGRDIENTEIKTKYQIQKIKVGLQMRFPHLMSSIIEVLLFREEMDLACYLTAYYDFYLDIAMIIKAIDHDYLKWLNFVWAFKKNYY